MTETKPRRSHEIYLELCRMDNQGLHGTPEAIALRSEYSEVMRRENAEIWGSRAFRETEQPK